MANPAPFQHLPARKRGWGSVRTRESQIAPRRIPLRVAFPRNRISARGGSLSACKVGCPSRDSRGCAEQARAAAAVRPRACDAHPDEALALPFELSPETRVSMPPLAGEAVKGLAPARASMTGGDPKDKPYPDGTLLHEIFVQQVFPSNLAVGAHGTQSRGWCTRPCRHELRYDFGRRPRGLLNERHCATARAV